MTPSRPAPGAEPRRFALRNFGRNRRISWLIALLWVPVSLDALSVASAEVHAAAGRSPPAAAFGIPPGAADVSAAPIPVIDLHVDLSYQVGYKGRPFASGSGEFRAEDLVPAGLSGVVLPLFVPRYAKPDGRTSREFEASYARVYEGILATRPYALPGCGVRRAAGERREVETWLAFEGSEPLAADEQALRAWAVRGVRVFGLVHAQHNDLAESSGEASKRSGLSQRGERFVRAVYAVGGIVDVSHASDEATTEALQIARDLGRPVVATHSNARARAPHPRNLTDAHIRGIAESGGVVGVNFHQPFLASGTGHVTLDTVVAMIGHLVRVGGSSVVAIGSDFEGGIRPVPGLEGASRYQVLARALLSAGYSRPDVESFLAGNARRVLCSAPLAARSR